MTRLLARFYERIHPTTVIFGPPPGWEPEERPKPAHTCPECRRIVVRTDGHHCGEEGS